MTYQELGYISNTLTGLADCGLDTDPSASIIFQPYDEERPFIAAARKGVDVVAIKALTRGKERMNELLREYAVLRALNLKVGEDCEVLPRCEGWYADTVQMGLISSPLGTPL